MNRRSQYEEIGKEQGWQHTFAGRALNVLPIGPFQLLYGARTGLVSQGMRRDYEQGSEILFDFDYLDSNVIFTTCFYARDTSFNLPIFYMQPRSSWDVLSKLLVNNLIYFDDFPDFNKHYKFVSPIKNFNALSNQICTYFSFEKGWSIEGNGHQLLIYKEGKFIEYDLLRPFIQVSRTIVAMFKGIEVIG